jgi:membrane-bound lytic murein transglycosylase A
LLKKRAVKAANSSEKNSLQKKSMTKSTRNLKQAVVNYQTVLFTILFFATLACGCAPKIIRPPEEFKVLVKLQVSEYPDFVDDTNYDNLEEGILQSLSYLKKRPKDMKFKFGEDLYEISHMIDSLSKFLEFTKKNPSSDELRRYLDENYNIYKSTGSNGDGEVLFTGYYEPFLEGSLLKSDVYKYPVYGTPSDLITIDLSLFSAKYSGEKITGRYTGKTVVPYHDRKEIDTVGILEEKAPVIVWIKDRIDLFFLQIQGSGKIRLTDGEIINVHYHASNGRPYKSIGNFLIEREIITKSDMSMQKIRAYLSANPEKIDDILNYNPSYVFFKTEKEGPLGFLGVKLTPERSVALDRRIFPPAGLVYIETEKPVVSESGEIIKWVKANKFVLNQDTGGAIQGPGRADIFWGNGIYAETAAGNMKHKGSLYFLILKTDP